MGRKVCDRQLAISVTFFSLLKKSYMFPYLDCKILDGLEYVIFILYFQGLA